MDRLDLADDELDAIHEVELGLEWLHRAHGALVAFHHKTGHAMDHLATAEELLRGAGHDELADRLREDVLPSGVVPRQDGPGMWTYEVLEAFEGGVYADVREFEIEARDAVTDGVRHANERRQETEWRARARDSRHNR